MLAMRRAGGARSRRIHLSRARLAPTVALYCTARFRVTQSRRSRLNRRQHWPATTVGASLARDAPRRRRSIAQDPPLASKARSYSCALLHGSISSHPGQAFARANRRQHWPATTVGASLARDAPRRRHSIAQDPPLASKARSYSCALLHGAISSHPGQAFARANRRQHWPATTVGASLARDAPRRRHSIAQDPPLASKARSYSCALLRGAVSSHPGQALARLNRRQHWPATTVGASLARDAPRRRRSIAQDPPLASKARSYSCALLHGAVSSHPGQALARANRRQHWPATTVGASLARDAPRRRRAIAQGPTSREQGSLLQLRVIARRDLESSRPGVRARQPQTTLARHHRRSEPCSRCAAPAALDRAGSTSREQGSLLQLRVIARLDLESSRPGVRARQPQTTLARHHRRSEPCSRCAAPAALDRMSANPLACHSTLPRTESF